MEDATGIEDMGIFRTQEFDRHGTCRGRTVLALLAAFAACGLQVKDVRAECISHRVEADGDNGCASEGREAGRAGTGTGLPGGRTR